MKIGSSYFGNRIPRHAQKDMQYLVDKHFTYVVHTFSENDYHFYAKTMKEIVKISRDQGLETQIDPWGVGKVFGGEAFSEYIASHPEVCEILSDGKPAGIACPNNPEFRKFMRQWCETAVAAEPDYLFWDEPHFYISGWMGGRPGTWGCRCKFCKVRFEELYGHPLPMEETEEVKEFKHRSIVDFLQEMIDYGHELGVRNSLCILPGSTVKDEWFQELAAMENLDNFGTDPYWYALKKEVKQYVGDFSRKVNKVCREMNREGHIWIQGFKVPGGREEEIQTAVKEAVQSGIRNLAVWGFDACSHISSIAPDNPEKTWDIICNAFGEVKNLT
ncbi:hypothetical protein JW926_10400 [Candidatus Sumerlaeota bacterium]|nr:hypothetical protein [Candidatus Sumerlaeota bacterium]